MDGNRSGIKWYDVGLTKFYILFLLACCFACKKNNSVNEVQESINQEIITETPDTLLSVTEFDKAKWIAKDDHHYPYRNLLLEVLLTSHTLDSLNKEEILNLLGKPDRTDNNYLFYQIEQKRLGFWPLHTKTMVIKMNEANTVEWIRIHE